MRTLIERWRDDLGHISGVVSLGRASQELRISIRRGLSQKIEEIEKGSFGNVNQGPSLKTAVGSLADQLSSAVVAPRNREDEVRARVKRQTFRHVADLQIPFLAYRVLDRQHRDAMARFDQGLKAIHAVARTIP